MKDGKPQARPNEPKEAMLSMDRKTREAAARELVKTTDGKGVLRNMLDSTERYTSATSLAVLSDDEQFDVWRYVQTSEIVELREMAIPIAIARGQRTNQLLDKLQLDAIRAVALPGFSGNLGLSQHYYFLYSNDPFLRHAAIERQARNPYPPDDAKADIRLSYLLAARKTEPQLPIRLNLLSRYLKDSDPDVRFLSVKWVSDEKLLKFRPQIVEMLKNPKLDPREFIALTTALARLDDKPVNDDGLADYFIARIADKTAPLPTRLMALRSVNVLHGKFKTEMLTGLLDIDDAAFRIEVLRALKDRNDPKPAVPIAAMAKDAKQPVRVRAQAILTLSSLTTPTDAFIKEIVESGDNDLAAEAMRASANRPIPTDKRPAATDTDAWLKLLEGEFDLQAGRRIFENTKLTNCSSCHRVDGRGANVGPDLSLIGRTEKKWIVESILQPSAVVAPHYQTWKVETLDGKVFTGILIGTHLDESYYLNEKGQRIKVLATDVAEVSPVKASIMPDGLLDKLTIQEIRDLMAYLITRK